MLIIDMLNIIKKDMKEAYEDGENFPVFDLTEHEPAIVPKVACIQTYNEKKEPQLKFASIEGALQFLADISQKTIKIK